MKEANTEPLSAPSELVKRGATGIVIRINKSKGWGFVITEDVPFTKIFFHWTELTSNINFLEVNRKDKFVFDVMKGDNGYRAINIRKV